jgi:Nuclease-related domain
MAGESAGRLARRHRESTTGSILDGLHSDGWAVFHDVRLPGRHRPHLDHVVVGPPGVFVVHSKSWSGRIEVRDNRFWCRGRRQDRVVGAASECALAVSGLVSGPAATTVRSALCFERVDPVVGWCCDVMLCSTSSLREVLTRRPAVLTPDEVTLASIELDLGFRSAEQRPVRAPQLPGTPTRSPRPRRTEPRASRWLRRALIRLSIVLLVTIVLMTQAPRLADFRDSLVDRIKDAVVPDSLTPELAYDSCAALREIYPDGVGTGTAVREARLERALPAVQPEVARFSAALDKDGDGLVCERGR